MNKTELKAAIEQYQQRKLMVRSATVLNLYKETTAQQEARIARLLNPDNYNAFFQYYFGGDSTMSMSDSPCSKFQVSATKKLVDEKFINQFRIWFRGSAKSTHTNVGNTFLLKQSNEAKFSVIVGANELRANLLLSDLQVHLESNERIIKDFGTQIQYGDWSKGMFETTDNCYFMALGIDQPFRGLRRFANRVDFASVDDIEDREVANNPRRVRQRAEKILSDLGGAFGKNRRRLVVCNNLITNTGVVHYLLNKIGDKPITHISKVEIFDKKGLPSWIERYTLNEVKQLHLNTDYYTWQREYMNCPIEEGKLFQDKWLPFTQVPAINQYDALIVYGDLSYKDSGDYKALVLVGKKGRDYFIIDCFVAQTTRSNCARWLYDTYEKRKLADYNCSYMIEGLFAMDEFTSDFDEEGDIRGYHIPVIADKKTKEGKYDRIESMVGFFERGNVHFNERLKDSTSMKALRDQLLAFEKGSTAHDDGPDALQSAISKLNKETFNESFEIRTTSFKEFRNKKHHF